MANLTLAQALDLAVQRHNAGHFGEAENLYRKILAVAPGNIDALHLLGRAVQARGALDEAEALMRQAIAGAPATAELHNSLGGVLSRKGNLDGAFAAYSRAIECDLRLAVAHSSLGEVLHARGDLEGALAKYDTALELEPNAAALHYHRGLALQGLGRRDEAIAEFQSAIRLKPDHAAAHSDLGVALHAGGQLSAAVAAFGEALCYAPNLATVHVNLGNVLKDQGLSGEAVAAYRRALALEPDHLLALSNLANLLKDSGEIEEALPLYRRAIARPESTPEMQSNYLVALHYSPQATLPVLAEAHAEYDRRYAEPLGRDAPAHANTPDPARPLRLGFVSPHFGAHPVGHFLVRLLENLDLREFAVVCYSDRPHTDALNARLRARAAEWQEVGMLSDAALALRIREDRIDVLFDLAGHTAGHRLLVFARRPAPVQITWLDYVGTTGLSAMDYIIADPTEIPPAAESCYREKVLRMPHDYITFDPPAEAPPVAAPPAMSAGYVSFGSFNIPAKTTPLIVETWCRILQRVPGARLLLKNAGLDDPRIAARYRELFARQGIGGERVILRGWSPQRELLATYQEIDIALDTFPYNGGLTTCEALWMGVPVITCPGETFASRHGLTHLSAVGFTETIARDLDHYVELAVAWAGDLARLREVRAGLRAKVEQSALCDGKKFAEHFSATLRQVWGTWCEQQRVGG